MTSMIVKFRTFSRNFFRFFDSRASFFEFAFEDVTIFFFEYFLLNWRKSHDKYDCKVETRIHGLLAKELLYDRMNRKPKLYHIGDGPKPVAKPDPRDPKTKILGISLCLVDNYLWHEDLNLFLSSIKPWQNVSFHIQ
jgi:hypothetical protein